MTEDIRQLRLNHPDLARLIIPASDVAGVYEDNHAEHALLVLIKSGYSAVPVFKTSTNVTGVISKTLILDAILGLERIEFEALDSHHVVDLMNREVPRIKQSDTLMKALQTSIDAPFLCVTDEAGEFVGMLTRRGILAYLHQVIRQAPLQPS